MKKSLLAIAIAAAVPAVASAQVSIGGLMDISVVNVDNGAKSKLVTSTGDRSSNNINFTGVEKIGDLSGFFHAEFGFDVDNGTFNGAAATTSATTGVGMTRRSVVGIRGGFGEIRGGRDYTPIFIATNTNSIHGTSGYASNLTYINAAAGGTGVVGHDVRFSNGVWYHSPVMNGFSLRAAISNGTGFEDIGANTKNGNGTSFALVYDQGPIYAQISNSSQKDYSGTGTALVDTAGPGKKEVMSYGGKYTMGAFQVAVGAQNAESTSTAGVKVKNETVYYGAAFTTGATRISLQGANVKVSGSGTGSTGAGVGKDYTALTLLVNHALSKRTSIYGTWGQINNEANQNVGVRSNGLTYAAAGINRDPSAFGVGLVHSF